MTSAQYIGAEATSSLPREGYGEAFLELIEVPPGRTLAVLILSQSGGRPVARAQFERLNDEQLRIVTTYGSTRAHSSASGFIGASICEIIADTVRRRWPKVKIFLIPGCECHDGIEHLFEGAYDR